MATRDVESSNRMTPDELAELVSAIAVITFVLGNRAETTKLFKEWWPKTRKRPKCVMQLPESGWKSIPDVRGMVVRALTTMFSSVASLGMDPVPVGLFSSRWEQLWDEYPEASDAESHWREYIDPIAEEMVNLFRTLIPLILQSLKNAPGEKTGGDTSPACVVEVSGGDAREMSTRGDEARTDIRADTDSPISHGADFTWLVVHGTRYTFTKGQQAAVIRLLFEEWRKSGRRDGCGQREDTLAENVGAVTSSFRIQKVFNRHPAKDSILRSPSKGVWALYLDTPS